MHDEISAHYKDMIYAGTKQEIETKRKAFIRKWRLKCKAVADSLGEAGDKLFTFTRFPKSQWKSIRTSNAIERLHEEFKRRIKTQTVLPSAETAAMLFWALLASGQIAMRKVDGWQSLVAALHDNLNVSHIQLCHLVLATSLNGIECRLRDGPNETVNLILCCLFMVGQTSDHESSVFPFERDIARGNADDLVLGNGQKIASDPFFSSHPDIIGGEHHAVDRIAAIDADMRLAVRRRGADQQDADGLAAAHQSDAALMALVRDLVASGGVPGGGDRPSLL